MDLISICEKISINFSVYYCQELPNRFLTNFNNLLHDYEGIYINVGGIFNFIIIFLFTLTLFTFYYLLGKKINKHSFHYTKIDGFLFFVNIALGYMAFGSVIGILGLFSLLHEKLILLITLITGFYILFTFKKSLNYFNDFLYVLKKIRKFYVTNKYLTLCITTFVIITFLRVIPPEIGEDSYHTDLPITYLENNTIMIPIEYPQQVVAFPQLPEMSYLITIIFNIKDASRYIHFVFYLLIVLLIMIITSELKWTKLKYAALLFVTAPVVIKHATVAYTDFFMIFCFLLSAVLIAKKRSYFLGAIIFGGMLSAKTWTLIYIMVPSLYLLIVDRSYLYKRLIKIMLIVGIALIPPSIWYLRSFILSADPIYPILFNSSNPANSSSNISDFITDKFGINFLMFNIDNLIVFSPLFFMSLLFFLIYLKKASNTLLKISFTVYILIIFFEHLFFKGVFFGRHLIAMYTSIIFVASTGLYYSTKLFFTRIIFLSLLTIIISYYLINTLLILPYGFGWANKEAYLTRTLYRDNVSYYNFDGRFEKHINKNDLIVTYGLANFYYSNFKYKDVNQIFSITNRDFALLKEYGATKLLIKGGDIFWFCYSLQLVNCDSKKVKLLTVYPDSEKKFQLYSIE